MGEGQGGGGSDVRNVLSNFLAANEFFCMSTAKRAGLRTPEFFMSDNGGLFIMKRFDIGNDGLPLGFDDLCSLQALGTAQKLAFCRFGITLRPRVRKPVPAFICRQFNISDLVGSS
jgi:hypothetical protein